MATHAHEAPPTAHGAHHDDHEDEADRQPDEREDPPEAPYRRSPASRSPHDWALLPVSSVERATQAPPACPLRARSNWGARGTAAENQALTTAVRPKSEAAAPQSCGRAATTTCRPMPTEALDCAGAPEPGPWEGTRVARAIMIGHAMEMIENRTFDEIKVGDSASLSRTLTREDVQLFAVMSGDVNPAHVDEEYAKSDLFHKIVAHGMWGGTLISTLLGTKLPGPGTIYLSQTLRFRKPVALGDTITVSVTASARDSAHHRITFDCRCVNQNDEVVIEGIAEVLAPTEKVRRPRAILPTVHMHDRGARYRQLIEMTRGLESLRTAVVHPVDRNSLLGALDAAQASLIVPVLVGPEAKIRAVAAAESVDLSPYRLVPTRHSHEAAERAVAMVRTGEVEALMKGSLHTGER